MRKKKCYWLMAVLVLAACLKSEAQKVVSSPAGTVVTRKSFAPPRDTSTLRLTLSDFNVMMEAHNRLADEVRELLCQKAQLQARIKVLETALRGTAKN